MDICFKFNIYEYVTMWHAYNSIVHQQTNKSMNQKFSNVLIDKWKLIMLRICIYFLTGKIKVIWKVNWWFELLIPRCFLIYIHHFHWAEELKRFKMHWIPSSASPFLTQKETFLTYFNLKFSFPICPNTNTSQKA